MINLAIFILQLIFAGGQKFEKINFFFPVAGQAFKFLFWGRNK